MTRVLVYLCLGFYLAELVVQSVVIGGSFTEGGVLGFLGVGSGVHLLFGGPNLTRYPAETGWWVVATYGFLHGGILHIFMNMMALRVLGPVCEILFGRWRMIILCAVSTLVGGILCRIFDEPAIGFSGAICGLLGAALIHARRTGQMMAYQQLLNAVIFVAIISFLPGISLWGHLGGFLGGVLFAWVALHRSLRFLRDPRTVRGLGALSIAVFVAAYASLATAILIQVQNRELREVDEIWSELVRTIDGDRELPPPSFYPPAHATLEQVEERVPEDRQLLRDWRDALTAMEERARDRDDLSLRPIDNPLIERLATPMRQWRESHPDRYGFRALFTALASEE